MTRRRRWFLRGVAGAAALLLAGGVALWWVLPGLVERQARAALEGMGLGPAELRVTHVGWSAARVEAVRLGAEERFGVEAIDVTYTPGSLWAGRVHDVTIVGLVWHIAYANGKLDWRPFEALDISGEAGAALPVRSVSVRDSRVIVEVPEIGERIELGIAGSFGAGEGSRVARWSALLAHQGEQTLFKAAGEYDVETGELRLVNVQQREVVVAEDGVLGRVIEVVTGLKVSGRFDTSGVVRPGVELGSDLRIAVADGRVGTLDSAYTLAGLNGEVRVTSVAPLATELATLTFGELHLGEIVIDEGSIGFAVDRPGRVRVEQARWRQGQGWFGVAPFAVDPAKPDFQTQVTLDHVALERWLSVVSMGRVDGRGRVKGSVAFRVAMDSELRFAFGEGRIESMWPGTLSVVDLKTAEEWVDASGVTKLADLNVSELVRGRIIEALGEFRFETLVFKLSRATGETQMRVTTRGEGTRGAKQAIGGLTVNVSGVNGAVNRSLRTKLMVDRAGEAWLRVMERIGNASTQARPKESGEQR